MARFAPYQAPGSGLLYLEALNCTSFGERIPFFANFGKLILLEQVFALTGHAFERELIDVTIGCPLSNVTFPCEGFQASGAFRGLVLDNHVSANL